MGDDHTTRADCPLTVPEPWEALSADATVTPMAVTRWKAGVAVVVDDSLAQEVPIALVYNGISHVVMLATPADLEDFAYGFSFTEGIISDASQIYGVEAQAQWGPEGDLQGISLHIELASAQFVALKAQRRNLTGRTGCGLCGAESLQQVFKQPALAAVPPAALSAKVISEALLALAEQQPLQQLTGATHACALGNLAGQVVCVREDVGRHNAMDKLIGHLLRERQALPALWAEHWMLTTSRASYEMVQKVAMTGGRVLVAMSAPTALAVNLAREYGFLLAGFARSAQCVVYSGALTAADVDQRHQKVL